MSQLVSRILLAIFVFPLASILYLVTFIAIAEGLRTGSLNYVDRDTFGFLFAGGLTWAVVGLYWWALWRSSVIWTTARIGSTAAAVLAAAIVGAAVRFLVNGLMDGRDKSFGLFVASVLAILLWLIATVFIWRETAAERADRLTGASNAISCPTCGYNLTGLKESRCPECGSTFTLDELLARQTSRASDVE